MTETIANEQLIRDYFAALSRSDLDQLERLFAPDARIRFAGGTGAEQELVFDREGVMIDLRENLGKLYDADFGIQPEIQSLVAQGDKVAVEVRIRGRAASTGAPYDNQYAFFFTIRDGRIVESHEHLDTVYARERLLAPAGHGLCARAAAGARRYQHCGGHALVQERGALRGRTQGGRVSFDQFPDR
jgi:ketosteroid isomerase-like protein